MASVTKMLAMPLLTKLKKTNKTKNLEIWHGIQRRSRCRKCETRYCRLCRKKETRKQCGYGGALWDRYAVKDATENERQEAAEESGITSEGGEGICPKARNLVIVLCVTGLASKSSDGKLVGFNSVVNMQENPVPDNQDKQLNPSAGLVR